MILLLAALAAGCVQVEGDRIFARDISETEPAYGALPAEQALGYAPAPGARRLLTHQGLPPVCVERASEQLTPERILEALRAAAGRRDVKVELLEYSRHRVPRGELEFVPPGPGATLWHGRVRYGTSRTMPVWARARVTVRERRVFAAESLAAGRPIGPADVRLEEGDYPPGQAMLDTIEQAVGRVPRHAIRRGAALAAAMLADPPAIGRGDTVTVEVFSGAAQLKLEARAESSGAPGDVIVLRNPENGRRFTARVEDKGKAKLDAMQDSGAGAGGTLGAGRRQEETGPPAAH